MFAYGSQITEGKDGAKYKERGEQKSPASILFVPARSYIFCCGSMQIKKTNIKKITDVFGGHQVHLEKDISGTALSNSTMLFSSV